MTNPSTIREVLGCYKNVARGHDSAMTQAEALATIEQLVLERELEARIDERGRVAYEHGSFTKEWFKDRALDPKQWWVETAATAHDRRTTELRQALKQLTGGKE